MKHEYQIDPTGLVWARGGTSHRHIEENPTRLIPKVSAEGSRNIVGTGNCSVAQVEHDEVDAIWKLRAGGGTGSNDAVRKRQGEQGRAQGVSPAGFLAPITNAKGRPRACFGAERRSRTKGRSPGRVVARRPLQRSDRC